MKHESAITASLPNPRMPPSLLVLVIQALLIAVFFNPAPVATAATIRGEVSTRSDFWLPPIEQATESDVLRAFSPPEMPWSVAHRGIDIRASGNEVLAPGSGEVTFVGVVVNRPVISIRHPDGLISSLEPVESDLEVGATVSEGQVIGELSAEVSHCDVQCVHWGVRVPDAWQIGSTVRDLYIDPAFLLGWSEPSILWPVHSDPAG